MTTTASDATSTDTPTTDTARTDGTSSTVADQLGEMFTALFDGVPPVAIEFWDGSSIGGGDGEHDRVIIRRPDALRRIVWSPDELGIAPCMTHPLQRLLKYNIKHNYSQYHDF